MPVRKRVTTQLPVTAEPNGDLLPEAQRRRMEVCRLRIQTSKLIDRVQSHALGKAKMTPTQLTAAQVLLRKTLPDLVGIKTEINVAPVIFNFRMDAPEPEPDIIEAE